MADATVPMTETSDGERPKISAFVVNSVAVAVRTSPAMVATRCCVAVKMPSLAPEPDRDDEADDHWLLNEKERHQHLGDAEGAPHLLDLPPQIDRLICRKR